MIISEIGIRGFKSFGNNEFVLKLDEDEGKLILLAGKNGAGKSLVQETNINVDIPIDDMDIDDILLLLDTMDSEREIIFKYIKENNISLYEKISGYQQKSIR